MAGWDIFERACRLPDTSCQVETKLKNWAIYLDNGYKGLRFAMEVMSRTKAMLFSPGAGNRELVSGNFMTSKQTPLCHFVL
jgi:hypothetical protein